MLYLNKKKKKKKNIFTCNQNGIVNVQYALCIEICGKLLNKIKLDFCDSFELSRDFVKKKKIDIYIVSRKYVFYVSKCLTINSFYRFYTPLKNWFCVNQLSL